MSRQTDAQSATRQELERRWAMMVRSDVEQAAEEFVQSACMALGLPWEASAIREEADRLTDAAFGWRDEEAEAVRA